MFNFLAGRLYYILTQPKESLLYRFLEAQITLPTKGCWANMVIHDLEYIDLKISFEQIASLSKHQFRNILKKNIKIASLKYLLSQQKSKGNDINYITLKMSEYLLPHDGLTSNQQIQILP